MPTESSRSVATTFVSAGNGGNVVCGDPSSAPTPPPPSRIGPDEASFSDAPPPSGALSGEREDPHLAVASSRSDATTQDVTTIEAGRSMFLLRLRDLASFPH